MAAFAKTPFASPYSLTLDLLGRAASLRRCGSRANGERGAGTTRSMGQKICNPSARAWDWMTVSRLAPAQPRSRNSARSSTTRRGPPQSRPRRRRPAPAPVGLPPQQMPPEEMDDDMRRRLRCRRDRKPPPARRPPHRSSARTAGQRSAAQPLAAAAGQRCQCAGRPGRPSPPVAAPGTARRRPAEAAGSPPARRCSLATKSSPKCRRKRSPIRPLCLPASTRSPAASFRSTSTLNETVQFGALQVTPRVCYTRPPTEAANTDGFVDVDEVTLQGEVKRVFTGWMFAASPGLHAVEHPIYDVWLTDCKGGTSVVADTQPTAPARPSDVGRFGDNAAIVDSSVIDAATGSSPPAQPPPERRRQQPSAAPAGPAASPQPPRTSCNRRQPLRADPGQWPPRQIDDIRQTTPADSRAYLSSVASPPCRIANRQLQRVRAGIGRSSGSAAKLASPIRASASRL